MDNILQAKLVQDALTRYTASIMNRASTGSGALGGSASSYHGTSLPQAQNAAGIVPTRALPPSTAGGNAIAFAQTPLTDPLTEIAAKTVIAIPGLKVLEEVLELIPVEEKHVFITATRLCPDLVRSESNPQAFLNRSGGNSWSAARRLVRYWQARYELFQERCFLPLNLSGQGAMKPGAVAALRTGFHTVLPPNDDGRPLLMADFSRCPPGADEDVLLQCFFYIRSIISLSKIAQEDGYIGIAIYNQSFLAHVSLMRRMSKMLEEAFPIQVKNIFAVGIASGLFFQMVQWLEPFFNVSQKLALANGASTDEVFQRLQKHNFRPRCLPASLGGEFDVHAFERWFRLHASLEPNESYSKLGFAPFEIPHGMNQTTGIALDSNSDSSSRIPLDIAQMGLFEALEEIPAEQKSAFLEALDRCPNIVYKEASPKKFLVCERRQSAVAARRLVEYWELRRNFFQDRAFRPMDATGHGALSQDEAELLKSGFLRVLPADNTGRPVICWDQSKLVNVDKFLETARCWFYILTVAAEDPVAQDRGVVFLADDPDVCSIMRVGSNTFDSILQMSKSIPIACFSTQSIVIGKSLDPRGSHKTQAAIFLESLSTDLSSCNVSSPDHVAQRLIEAGLRNEGIPDKYGGLWRQQNDSDWRVVRSQVESGRHSSSATSAESVPLMLAHIQIPSENTPVVMPSKAPLGRLDGKEEQLLQAMEDAIMQLPAEDRADYCRVKQEAPDLIEKDSNPSLYFRYEKFNTLNAARRLALYWKHRCTYFNERALLPMNQTGEGALSKKDVALLATGHWTYLPTDSEGRTVVFHEASRPVKHDMMSQIRNIFYMHHVVLQNDLSVEKGVVGIVQIGAATNSTKQAEVRKSIASLVEDVFPFNFHCVHVVPKAQNRSYRDSSMPLVLSLFGTKGVNRHIHRCDSKSQIIARLASFGLSKENLPVTLGGDWSFEQFVMWQERQIRIEWELPLGALDEDDGKYSAKPLSALNEGERKERKRRYNVLHSRRKRRRDRVESDVLSRQVEELEEAQEELKLENQMLEEALKKARKMMGVSEVSGNQLFASSQQNTGNAFVPQRDFSGLN